MRILIWSHVRPTGDSAYWFWLKRGLEAIGHQVIALDSHALASLYGPVGMRRVILQYAQAYAVNAALVVPGNFAEPALLDALRQQGVVLVGLRYDDGILAAPGTPIPQRARLRQFTALDAGCDFVTTVCRRAVTLYPELGVAAPTYVPIAYPWQLVDGSPKAQAPVIRYCGSARYEPDQPTSWRVQVVRALLAENLPIELLHDSWAMVPGCAAAARPTPDLPALFESFRTATVNLSPSAEFAPRPSPMIRLLHLEIASAGGMQVTQPCAELADMFTAGRDFAPAETVADYVDRCRYFLAHPDEARRMGQNSRQALIRLGGWERWWQTVADGLSAKGIALDLAAPHREPDPRFIPCLSLVAASLAHAHETAGDLATASLYFEELLTYDPQDYAGLAGLARLAADPEVAGALWQEACDAVAPTYFIALPPRFGSKAFDLGTNFTQNAAVQWLHIALKARRFGEVVAIIARLAVHGPQAANAMAVSLDAAGEPGHALACLDLAIRHWPEDIRAWRLRAQLHARLGRSDAAAADQARADTLALDPRPAV